MKLLLIVAIVVLTFSCRQKRDITFDRNAAFGIDISHCNGNIDWELIRSQEDHPISFVIIRATMGDDRKDRLFQENWSNAKQAGLVVGAYHYYDPNEHSYTQAENYLSTVTFMSGDFLPIVDIEQLSKVQSVDRLKLGLQRWLMYVEERCGVKPMIYTGLDFYKQHLSKEFAEYPLWVAAYSSARRSDEVIVNAAIHQFSEQVRIPGVKAFVDGNDIKNWDMVVMK